MNDINYKKFYDKVGKRIGWDFSSLKKIEAKFARSALGAGPLKLNLQDFGNSLVLLSGTDPASKVNLQILLGLGIPLTK